MPLETTPIFLGTEPDDDTGTELRAGGDIINDNFAATEAAVAALEAADATLTTAVEAKASTASVTSLSTTVTSLSTEVDGKADLATSVFVIPYGADFGLTLNVVRPAAAADAAHVVWVGGPGAPVNALAGDEVRDSGESAAATLEDLEAVSEQVATAQTDLGALDTRVTDAEDALALTVRASALIRIWSPDEDASEAAVGDLILVPSGTPAGDSVAPVMAGTLEAENGDGVVLITATANPVATDNVAVTALRIEVNGSLVDEVAGDGPLVDHPVPLANGATYTITVKARDAAGNIATTPLTVLGTPSAAPDVTAPNPPTDVTLLSLDGAFNVSWTDDPVGDNAWADLYIWDAATESEPAAGAPTVSVAAGTGFYQAAGRTNGTAYSVRLAGRDTTGNRSAKTTVDTVTPAAAGVGTPDVIEYIGASSVTTNSSATVANVPVASVTGLADGDFLVAFVAIVSATGDITPPSGWSAVPLTDVVLASTRFRAFYKAAAASESGNWAFTWADYTGRGHAIVRAYRNVLELGVSGSNSDLTSDTTAVATGLTTAVDASMLVVGWSSSINSTITAIPGSMSNLVQTGGGSGHRPIATADELWATAGATGTRVATLAGASNSGGIMVALRPTLA